MKVRDAHICGYMRLLTCKFHSWPHTGGDAPAFAFSPSLRVMYAPYDPAQHLSGPFGVDVVRLRRVCAGRRPIVLVRLPSACFPSLQILSYWRG